ncbi:cytochrome P450 [Actinomadura terrae]|uniref:cytochrome P450 n=1 Tax=Actinomadura terrae TaxID=604353 RepID=UPI001FA7C546|nr:cytochrome P450 [Actinomadura terrae]
MLRRASNAEIPGPDGGLFARHLKAYEAAPAEYLTWCNREYGDVFRFDTDVVVVNDPVLIQQVLVRTNRDAVPNANPLRGGRFPGAEQTGRWMRARQEALAVLRPAALPAHLPSVSRVMETDLRALEGEWFDPAEQGWRFCLRAFLSLYAPHPSPQLEDALMDSFTVTAAASLDRVPNWWPSRARRRIEAADQRIRDRISSMLDGDAPPENGAAPPTLLHILRNAPEPVPSDVAHGAAGMSALGAIGTMGGAWCWLLYYLAAVPDAFERIRGEVSASEWETVCVAPELALPYTYSFLLEVLRVRPPAWLLGRDTIADIMLGAVRIPAGTAVMFSPYLLHHDPRYWTDPDRFDPERWNGDERPHVPHAYLPFSSGPRGCLGAQLGLSVLLLAAAQLATGYDLDVPDFQQIGTEFGPVLLPTGMKCRLTRRPAAASG